MVELPHLRLLQKVLLYNYRVSELFFKFFSGNAGDFSTSIGILFQLFVHPQPYQSKGGVQFEPTLFPIPHPSSGLFLRPKLVKDLYMSINPTHDHLTF